MVTYVENVTGSFQKRIISVDILDLPEAFSHRYFRITRQRNIDNIPVEPAMSIVL